MVNNQWKEEITGKQCTNKAQCPQLETGVWPIRERFGCWQWGKCFFQLDHRHTFLAAHEYVIPCGRNGKWTRSRGIDCLIGGGGKWEEGR